jgi:3-dehydroshikimate dehydratase
MNSVVLRRSAQVRSMWMQAVVTQMGVHSGDELPDNAQMMIPGLVSITFRELPANRVIALAAEAGLGGIEWGGDVHVPHGDLTIARRVARLTADAALEISAYGSYYRAAVSPSQGLAFDSVCRTAVELGAPIIRIWAGAVGSSQADAGVWQAVSDDLRRACDRAAADGIGVSLEFHGGTLADTPESALRLLHDVDRPNLSTYWQPPNGSEKERCVRGLRLMRDQVRNVHVFHWWPDDQHRLPLETGADRWRAYFQAIPRDEIRRHASLEFVRDGDIAQFRNDARTLLALLSEVH